MEKITLVVVFNHHHSSAKNLVKRYNSRFSEHVRIAAPFGGSETIRYSSGSYLWQGAIVEYLRDLKDIDGFTLFIHDDLVLNSSLELHELIEDELEFLRLYQAHRVGGNLGTTWPWLLRVLTNWFTPKHQSFGTGVDDVVSVLKDSLLYQENQIYIDSLGSSRFVLEDGDSPISGLLSAWINRYFPDRTEFDFGLPLFAGISDFFMFPNSKARIVDDFLRRSIECGLFVEIAIPTLAKWLGLPIRYEQHRQHFPLGDDCNMFQNLNCFEEIERYFEENPEVLSIHPVKFSSFPELREELRNE